MIHAFASGSVYLVTAILMAIFLAGVAIASHFDQMDDDE